MANYLFAFKWDGTNMHYFRYDPDTTVITHTTQPVNIGHELIPQEDEAIFTSCDGLDRVSHVYTGGLDALDPVIDIVTIEDDVTCCTLNASDFQIVKANNTDAGTPNGSIEITSSTLDINEYQVSIDGGDTYIDPVDNELIIEGLAAGIYNVLIRNIGGSCVVSTQVTLVLIVTYPPLIIAETSAPADFSPVFSPIEFKFDLVNAQADIKSDLSGTYLEVDTQDARDFLMSLPIFRILDNTDYEGVWQVTGVDDLDDPQKFYFNATYTTDQTVNFVPFGQQVFYLYGERTLNTFVKISDISVAPDLNGSYTVRCEGFLQSLFEIESPAIEDDFSLHRKFYIIPADFDQAGPASIRTAVYSAAESLTAFEEELTPLSPAPINFINEQTAKGYPVIFSHLNLDNKRVTNVRSSVETDITTTAPQVYIPALPMNTYNFTWVNSDGDIADLNIDPPLPAWITLNASADNVVDLTINTFLTEPGGDYTPDDFSDDYNTFAINAIVGCYTFEFFDDDVLLFTLSTCVFPAQEIKDVCNSAKSTGPEIFNIAWINQHGGWSSFVFEGKKEWTRAIGKNRRFKRNGVLRKSAIEEVYDQVNVSLSNYTIRELLFISSLRTSIQAYLYNDESKDWDIPIFLNTENFPLYRKPFKQVEVEGSFSFQYATEIKVQKQ